MSSLRISCVYLPIVRYCQYFFFSSRLRFFLTMQCAKRDSALTSNKVQGKGKKDAKCLGNGNFFQFITFLYCMNKSLQNSTYSKESKKIFINQIQLTWPFMSCTQNIACQCFSEIIPAQKLTVLASNALKHKNVIYILESAS